jgi:hypothetical protein
MRTTLIVAIIGTIVVPLGIWWLNQSKPDIRFTLSDPIRIGQGEGGKIWQQMEVRNNGNIEAKDIQAKINAPVASYELSKNSEADKPEIFPSQDVFELRYPVLPPGGLFALTLGSTKNKIDIREISILHNRGRGVEAFSKKSLASAIWAPIGFTLAMLCYTVINGHLWLVERLDNSTEWYPEIFLKKKKPWYLKEEEWSRLRKKALGNIFNRSETYQETSTTKSYRVLSEDRPSYLSGDEWNELRKNAEERVRENILSKIQGSYDLTKLLLIFKLERPASMLESTWLALQKEANERFLTLKQRELIMVDFEKLPTFLNEKISEGVDADTWEKYLESVEKKCVEKIERELRISKNPIEFLEQQNLSRISAENVSNLKDVAYQRALQKIPDVHEPNEAKRFLRGTKPQWMKEEDYTRYSKIAQETLDSEQLMKEYEGKSTSIDKKEAELSKTMNQVTAQLDIISKVLNDPTTMDRIEEYNNPFAIGNFKNLKKISEILKKSNTTAHK